MKTVLRRREKQQLSRCPKLQSPQTGGKARDTGLVVPLLSRCNKNCVALSSYFFVVATVFFSFPFSLFSTFSLFSFSSFFPSLARSASLPARIREVEQWRRVHRIHISTFHTDTSKSYKKYSYSRAQMLSRLFLSFPLQILIFHTFSLTKYYSFK